MKPKTRRPTELSRILFADPENPLSPVDRLLQKAVEARATDLHLDPHSLGYFARLRVDGALVDFGELGTEEGQNLINQFKVMTGIDPGAHFVPRASRASVLIDGTEKELRVTLAPCISGPKLAVRLLDAAVLRRPLDSLGMTPQQLTALREWLLPMGGLLIVGGPTGSGKTTTLYSLLHEQVGKGRHVVTIEDPVEYEIDGINQMQVNAAHEFDFPQAVRSMLRLDPDELIIGEVRDEETADAVIRAAASGHTVLTTIHARDTVSTVTALRNLGTSNHDIATSVSVIVNQRLLRKLCADCRDEGTAAEQQVAWLKSFGHPVPEKTFHPDGCRECGFSGFRGRIGVFEIWRPDTVAYQMLLDGADELSLRRYLAEAGHGEMLDHALDLVEAGVTSLSEVMTMGTGMRADDWKKAASKQGGS